jgi:hypothetical protein
MISPFLITLPKLYADVLEKLPFNFSSIFPVAMAQTLNDNSACRYALNLNMS